MSSRSSSPNSSRLSSPATSQRTLPKDSIQCSMDCLSQCWPPEVTDRRYARKIWPSKLINSLEAVGMFWPKQTRGDQQTVFPKEHPIHPMKSVMPLEHESNKPFWPNC